MEAAGQGPVHSIPANHLDQRCKGSFGAALQHRTGGPRHPATIKKKISYGRFPAPRSPPLVHSPPRQEFTRSFTRAMSSTNSPPAQPQGSSPGKERASKSPEQGSSPVPASGNLLPGNYWTEAPLVRLDLDFTLRGLFFTNAATQAGRRWSRRPRDRRFGELNGFLGLQHPGLSLHPREDLP